MAQTTTNRRRPYNPVEEPEKVYADYVVCDPKGRKIGRVKEFFTNARGEPEYIMVRVGLFGMRSVLIPVGFVSVEEGQRTLTLH
jgi:PRC-barrel domain